MEPKDEKCFNCIYDGGIVMGEDNYFCKLVMGKCCGTICPMFFDLTVARDLIEKSRHTFKQ